MKMTNARRTILALAAAACAALPAARAAATCHEIKVDTPGAPSGVYTLDKPGGGQFQAYCEMQVAGGGWMLAMKQDFFGSGRWNHDDALLGDAALLTPVHGTVRAATDGSIKDYGGPNELLLRSGSAPDTNWMVVPNTFTVYNSNTQHCLVCPSILTHTVSSGTCPTPTNGVCCVLSDDWQYPLGAVTGVDEAELWTANFQVGGRHHASVAASSSTILLGYNAGTGCLNTWCRSDRHGRYNGGCQNNQRGEGDWTVWSRPTGAGNYVTVTEAPASVASATAYYRSVAVEVGAGVAPEGRTAVGYVVRLATQADMSDAVEHADRGASARRVFGSLPGRYAADAPAEYYVDAAELLDDGSTGQRSAVAGPLEVANARARGTSRAAVTDAVARVRAGGGGLPAGLHHADGLLDVTRVPLARLERCASPAGAWRAEGACDTPMEPAVVQLGETGSFRFSGTLPGTAGERDTMCDEWRDDMEALSDGAVPASRYECVDMRSGSVIVDYQLNPPEALEGCVPLDAGEAPPPVTLVEAASGLDGEDLVLRFRGSAQYRTAGFAFLGAEEAAACYDAPSASWTTWDVAADEPDADPSLCEVFHEARLPAAVALRECGFSSATPLSGAGFAAYATTVVITTTRDAGQVNGVDVTRTVQATVALQLELPTTVATQSAGTEAYGPAISLAAVSQQQYDASAEGAGQGRFTWTLATSVQWPYYLEPTGAGSSPQEFEDAPAASGGGVCDGAGEGEGEACTQLIEVTAAERSDCTLDTTVTVQFAVRCREAFAGACDPEFGTTASVEFQARASDFCARVAEVASVAPAMFVYSDADRTVISGDFVTSTMLYGRVTLDVEAGVALQAVSLEELAIVSACPSGCPRDTVRPVSGGLEDPGAAAAYAFAAAGNAAARQLDFAFELGDDTIAFDGGEITGTASVTVTAVLNLQYVSASGQAVSERRRVSVAAAAAAAGSAVAASASVGVAPSTSGGDPSAPPSSSSSSSGATAFGVGVGALAAAAVGAVAVAAVAAVAVRRRRGQRAQRLVQQRRAKKAATVTSSSSSSSASLELGSAVPAAGVPADDLRLVSDAYASTTV